MSFFSGCIVAKNNVVSFLLNGFSSRCSMYFAQRVSMPSWHSCSECWALCASIFRSTGRFVLWISRWLHYHRLTVFEPFQMPLLSRFSGICTLLFFALPLQAVAARLCMQRYRNIWPQTKRGLLVLFFFFWCLNGPSVFICFWGTPLRLNPECPCSCKSEVFC